MQQTWVQSLGGEDPPEEEMAPHSSTLAWRIPWTEEPGGLQSMGLQRIGYDWETKTLINVPGLHCSYPWSCVWLVGLKWEFQKLTFSFLLFAKSCMCFSSRIAGFEGGGYTQAFWWECSFFFLHVPLKNPNALFSQTLPMSCASDSLSKISVSSQGDQTSES